MDLGSIFTSSARGSWILLAMEIADLCSTERSGNSSIARGEAEYTEAPASLTTTYFASNLLSLMTSAIKLSVSRLAVPFPIAIISTLYFLIKSMIVRFDFSTCLGSTLAPLDFSLG